MKYIYLLQDHSKPYVAWIMGRASYELHSKRNGLFQQLSEQGHKIIKIVLSSKWTTLPTISDDCHLCHSWNEVIVLVIILS